MKIITGTAHRSLAQSIADNLEMPLTKANIKRFSDGEIFVEIEENVRGEDVFVVQPTSQPAHEHIMELLIIIDALRRGSAARITAVIPYYGYARQDRKTGPRTPITAKLLANMIESAGATRILTMDLHAGQIQGFFEVPTDNLYAMYTLISDIEKTYKINSENGVIVSPDVGGVARARAFAKRLGYGLAIIDKRRERANESEVMHVIGDVMGQNCFLVDDIVDTAGTICNAATALLEKGAKKVNAYASHGVLSGPAIERLENSDISEIVVTNSIKAAPHMLLCEKLRYVDISELLGESIKRIAHNLSVSSLFNK